jgi:hypothetical protein
MHNKYIITYEYHDNAQRMWKVVQLEKYLDFSLYSHHFSLLSLTSLLHCVQLMAKQADMWDLDTERTSTLSALSLETGSARDQRRRNK